MGKDVVKSDTTETGREGVGSSREKSKTRRRKKQKSEQQLWMQAQVREGTLK